MAFTFYAPAFIRVDIITYIFFVMYVYYMSLSVTRYEKCAQLENTSIGKRIGTRNSRIIHILCYFEVLGSPGQSLAVL